MKTIRLGVNIDHIATLRQARRGSSPEPVWAVPYCELAGADCITFHLREDRRHMQDRDLPLLKGAVKTRLNMEMAAVPEIVKIALALRPDQVTLVPERRQEITTEGGLDARGSRRALAPVVRGLARAGIDVSLFVDPEASQVEAAAALGAWGVEFHTGAYAGADAATRPGHLARLSRACQLAHERGLRVLAGHGLDYANVGPVCGLPHLEEVNIGHSIVSRAVFTGLERAVADMKRLLSVPTAGPGTAD